jgi:ssDNA-binding Zn-finger/Zn-ribbon topoisomerase 1
MAFNLPDGCRDDDPNAPWAYDDTPDSPPCPICRGDMEFINGKTSDSFFLRCSDCGLETKEHDTFEESIDDVKAHVYDDVPPCPICKTVENLTIVQSHATGLHQVQCSCGISGQWGKKEKEALVHWSMNF